MTKLDADLAAKLCAEAMEDDERMPEAPWEVWTSNSFRRIKGPNTADGGVLSALICRDGHPDLSMSGDNLKRLARTRNNLRALAEQLMAALKTIDYAVSENLNFNLKVAEEINEARRQRDAALCEVDRLKRELQAETGAHHSTAWKVAQHRNEWHRVAAQRDAALREVEKMRAVYEAAMRRPGCIFPGCELDDAVRAAESQDKECP